MAAWSAGRSERHRRSGSAFTSSLVRPESTERGCSSGSQPATTNSSFLCSSSQLSLPASSTDGPDEDELPLKLLAVQLHVQLAVGHGVDRVATLALVVVLPGPGVPDDDVAAAVLAGGDDPLEVVVVERMILDVERGATHRRVESGA